MLSSTKDETSNGRTLAEANGMVELLQKPGDIVYVPGGWYHVVMNLDFAIAVTQNFVTSTGFDVAWLKTRQSRPRLAARLLRRISILANPTVSRDALPFAVPRALMEKPHSFYQDVIARIEHLKFTPILRPSSSSSSNSSSSSSSQSEDEDVQSDASDPDSGDCRCKKCRQKKE